MLRTYVLDFGGWWYQIFTSMEFVYDNNYRSIIHMGPFENLYGRHYRSLVYLFEYKNSRTHGTDLI